MLAVVTMKGQTSLSQHRSHSAPGETLDRRQGHQDKGARVYFTVGCREGFAARGLQGVTTSCVEGKQGKGQHSRGNMKLLGKGLQR